MKKKFYLIPILGLLFSCAGEKAPEKLQEQIESIEKSTEKLDESIKSSDFEMKKNQSAIDSLLNTI